MCLTQSFIVAIYILRKKITFRELKHFQNLQFIQNSYIIIFLQNYNFNLTGKCLNFGHAIHIYKTSYGKFLYLESQWMIQCMKKFIETVFIRQVAQLYMALCFWYLMISDQCTRIHQRALDQSLFTRYQKHTAIFIWSDCIYRGNAVLFPIVLFLNNFFLTSMYITCCQVASSIKKHGIFFIYLQPFDKNYRLCFGNGKCSVFIPHTLVFFNLKKI